MSTKIDMCERFPGDYLYNPIYSGTYAETHREGPRHNVAGPPGASRAMCNF